MIKQTISEQRRRAFLSLWTGFVMTGNSAASPQDLPDEFLFETPFAKTEVVKYMVSPAGRGDIILPADAQAAYAEISVGMSEAAVNEILDDYLLEYGKLSALPAVWQRGYYQIGVNTQFWLEYERDERLTDNHREWRVIRKSPLEAKCVWHRYADNLIELPLE